MEREFGGNDLPPEYQVGGKFHDTYLRIQREKSDKQLWIMQLNFTELARSFAIGGATIRHKQASRNKKYWRGYLTALQLAWYGEVVR